MLIVCLQITTKKNRTMSLELKLTQASAIERQRMLEAICEGEPQHKKVAIPIDAADKANLDHHIAEAALRISDLEEEKKEYVKGMNDRLKAEKQEMQKLMEQHRTGMEIVDTQVYLVNNEETGMVESYAQDGRMIESKRMQRFHQHSERRRLAEGE